MCLHYGYQYWRVDRLYFGSARYSAEDLVSASSDVLLTTEFDVDLHMQDPSAMNYRILEQCL